MIKVPYVKPWLSVEDQLKKLKGKKLVVPNEDQALKRLAYINYYRFSG